MSIFKVIEKWSMDLFTSLQSIVSQQSNQCDILFFGIKVKNRRSAWFKFWCLQTYLSNHVMVSSASLGFHVEWFYKWQGWDLRENWNPKWKLPTNPMLKRLDVPLGPWAIDSNNGAEYQLESEITFLIFKFLYIYIFLRNNLTTKYTYLITITYQVQTLISLNI